MYFVKDLKVSKYIQNIMDFEEILDYYKFCDKIKKIINKEIKICEFLIYELHCFGNINVVGSDIYCHLLGKRIYKYNNKQKFYNDGLHSVIFINPPCLSFFVEMEKYGKFSTKKAIFLILTNIKMNKVTINNKKIKITMYDFTQENIFQYCIFVNSVLNTKFAEIFDSYNKIKQSENLGNFMFNYL